MRRCNCGHGLLLVCGAGQGQAAGVHRRCCIRTWACACGTCAQQRVRAWNLVECKGQVQLPLRCAAALALAAWQVPRGDAAAEVCSLLLTP